MKFCCCLFRLSIKCKIRYSHIIVVQKMAKKCTKKRDACAKLMFCLLNLLFCQDVLVAVLSLDI